MNEITGAELLTLSAERGVRLVALTRVKDVTEVGEKLISSADPDTLHDFRVATRRLRSWLRTYRAQLGKSVSKKTLRRLKAIAQMSGTTRDIDVRLEWLAGQRETLSRRDQIGATALQALLEVRRSEAIADLLREVEHDLSRTMEKMTEQLSVYESEVHLDREAIPKPFVLVTQELTRSLVASVQGHLAKVSGISDEKEAHDARIATKRLRYVLEPIRHVLPNGKPLIERLKSLQDTLGELHDAHVFANDIMDMVAEIVGDHARRELLIILEQGPSGMEARHIHRQNPYLGLKTLCARIRERADQAFERAAAEWLEGRGDGFFAEIVAAGDALEAGGGGAVSPLVVNPVI